jgi:hypothetical protein
MTGSAIINLQPAEYARLTGDAPFAAMVTGVFDAIPENQAEPFVVLGEATEIPYRSFANDGRDVTRTFHIYDRDGATLAGASPRGNKRALTIMDAMITLLESAPLTVQGFAVVDYAYEFGQPMPGEGDGNGGMYRHVVARFRATLEAA